MVSNPTCTATSKEKRMNLRKKGKAKGKPNLEANKSCRGRGGILLLVISPARQGCREENVGKKVGGRQGGGGA